MLTEGNAVGSSDVSLAQSRVQNGPIPDWVAPCPYEPTFKGEKETQVTFLLSDSQIHAEQSSLFVHQVIRLETMQAVQHWSQWRLEFEPKTQLVTLHSLIIRRGEAQIDQSSLEKSHLLQREEGLERFVIHGWFTLLMVLEDVRPGDILDFSYTIRSESTLFPHHGCHFFTPPRGVPVGKYHFAVQCRETRRRKWKSSGPELTPLEKQENGMVFWEWSGEKFVGTEPEVNSPTWHISYPWIQVTDFTNWQWVATGIAQAWAREDDGEGIAEIARDIQSQAADLPSQIAKAIGLVQDDCRYLSINLELGGHIPTSPGTVARRRYGDCKDLSFLLVCLLKKLGVTARPVLVSTFLRKAIANFLPMPSLFDHVVVEFELDGKRRWIDTTFKEQGGDIFSRIIPDYGFGLPIDPAATELVQAPPFEQPDLFDLREQVLLDTANGPSLMAVTLITEGSQAEQLRLQLKQGGMEEWTKRRTQIMVNRFKKVKRVGEIKYRDDRKANRFTLVEVFEINFALGRHVNPKLCCVSMPGNWLAGVLPLPPKTERRSPFLLPYPCHIQYTADINSPAIQQIKLPEPTDELRSDFIRYNRNSKTGQGYLVEKLSLTTTADSVPADQVQKHGELVQRVCQAATRVLTLLRGYSRSRPRNGFGDLPAEHEEAKPPPASKPIYRDPATSTAPRHRRHRRNKVEKRPKTIVWVLCLLFAILCGIIIALSRLK